LTLSKNHALADYLLQRLSLSSSQPPSFSWLFTGFVRRATRQVQVVKQDLLTTPEHLDSPLGFSWIRSAQSLFFCVVFYPPAFVFFRPFAFGNCVVCTFIYRFWLLTWYLQAFPIVVLPSIFNRLLTLMWRYMYCTCDISFQC
jgi:hypothetical protein